MTVRADAAVAEFDRFARARRLTSRRRAVASARRRAQWTVAAVGISSGLGAGLDAGMALTGMSWRNYAVAFSPVLLFIKAFVSPMTFLVAAVLFLSWLHRALANAALLGAPVRWSPGRAVLWHLVPFVSLGMPYFVMKELYAASDPTMYLDAPIYRTRAEPNYREGARELVSPPRWTFPAPILAWWLLFDVRMLWGFFAVSYDGEALAALFSVFCIAGSGALCVLVVRSVDARQRERCRRLDAGDEARAGAVGL